MSMGVPSDPVGTGEGLTGQGSPDMPNPMDQLVPTGDADAATTGQPGDASAPPDAAEGVAFSDDDVAFLQSPEVHQWLAENKPEGFHTEEEFQQHKAELQERINNQANVRVEQAERQAQEQVSIASAQTEALVAALYQSWQNEGLEQGTPDWQERENQIRSFAKSRVDARKLQNYEGNAQRSASVAQYAQSTYQELREWGVDPSHNANALNAVRNHLAAIQRGQYQDESQIAQAQATLVRDIVKAAQQQPQSQPEQPQPQTQQPQQNGAAPPQQPSSRTNFGPMRSVRGAGGAGARSYEEVYDAGEQKLVEQYGGDATKVPQSAWNDLDIEASMAAHR